MQNETPPADRYINGRRTRPQAYVDEHNMVYPLEQKSRLFADILMAVALLAVGVLLGYLLVVRGYAPMPRDARSPLPAAEITEPTRVPRQPPPAAEAPNDTSVQAGIDNYNATQLAHRAALAAPDSTPTPPEQPAIVAPESTALPEPGEPDFVGSFQEPTCSTMITYLRGSPCFGRAGQAPLPAEDADGFAASFK